jgi:hypothetical protein
MSYHNIWINRLFDWSTSNSGTLPSGWESTFRYSGRAERVNYQGSGLLDRCADSRFRYSWSRLEAAKNSEELHKMCLSSLKSTLAVAGWSKWAHQVWILYNTALLPLKHRVLGCPLPVFFKTEDCKGTAHSLRYLIQRTVYINWTSVGHWHITRCLLLQLLYISFNRLCAVRRF